MLDAPAAPKLGRLGDADAARDHGSEHELREVPAKLALDVVGRAGPLVVHGDHDAGQNQRRVEVAPHQLERLEELDQPLQRQVLRLDWARSPGRRRPAR